MRRQTVYIRLLLLVGIIVVINLISSRLFARLDFTADQRYTLSTATSEALTELNEVITVTAYFSEELPPQLLSGKQDFESLLVEYESRSRGNLVYEFINPNEDEQGEAKAQQAGVSPVLIDTRERDQVKQMRAYLGAVIQMGDRKEVIPQVDIQGGGMEYALTAAIKKLAVVNKPKIGLLQGHGEPSINALVQLKEQLSILYDVQPYNIVDTAEIPVLFKAIMLIDPKDSFPDSQLRKLDQYLSKGGNLFVAYSSADAKLNEGYIGKTEVAGLQSWLREKGVLVKDQAVIDDQCGSISVQQNFGGLPMLTQVAFPYFPIIGQFADHPASTGLEAVILPLSSAVEVVSSDTALQAIPLLFSSELSGSVNLPASVQFDKQWSREDFTGPQQVLGWALEGKWVGNSNSKVVIIGNDVLVTNGEGQAQQEVNADNINLVVNCIDWMADDSGLNLLRTKGVTSRPLDQVSDAQRNIIKYGNVVLPILLLLIYAFARRQSNYRKRRAWMGGRI